MLKKKPKTKKKQAYKKQYKKNVFCISIRNTARLTIEKDVKEYTVKHYVILNHLWIAFEKRYIEN